MKSKTWLLLLLSVVMVIGAGVGTAAAYFTTNATAEGGYVVRIGNETKIKETTLGSQKKVTIENTGDYAVFVRVKIFAGSEITDTPTYSTALWNYKASDGYYYYLKALEPREETGSTVDTGLLQFDLTIPKDDDAEEGDDVNVVLVYECVPAVFSGTGVNALPDLDTAWTVGKVTVIREGGAGT